jgi:hypothetical protein
MIPRLQLLNCFWLLLPIFAWNAVFSPRLPQAGFKSDAGVPKSILVVEQVLRVAVFIGPLFLPLRWGDPLSQAGLILFVQGMLLYFASWLLLIYRPETAWSRNAAGLLAPACTPLFWLAGVALVGGSWPYALLSLLFVGVHVYHNILAHGLSGAR